MVPCTSYIELLGASRSWYKKSLEALNKLVKENKVLLFWVRAHRGIQKNEEANNLTRKGVTAPTGPELFCLLGGNNLKAELRKIVNFSRELEWESMSSIRYSFLENYDRERSNEYIEVKTNLVYQPLFCGIY